MTKRYDYKIFPQTWKERLKLTAAAIGGLAIIVAILAFVPSFETGVWVTFDD